MKNIKNISSTTSTTSSSPKYSLNEDGFLKQLNEAVLAMNQPEKAKSHDVKPSQINFQFSIQQMNTITPTRASNQAVSLNAYKTQKSSVRSKSEVDL